MGRGGGSIQYIPLEKMVACVPVLHAVNEPDEVLALLLHVVPQGAGNLLLYEHHLEHTKGLRQD